MADTYLTDYVNTGRRPLKRNNHNKPKGDKMAFETKDMTGTMFNNDRKQNDNHPDVNGSAKIGGVAYYVSGWKKTTKDGKSFVSLSFKPKQEAPKQQGAHDGFGNSVNSDLPF